MSPRNLCILLLQWLARAVATAVVLFVGAFVVLEGLPNPLAQPWRVRIELLAMFVMFAGMVIGWRWDILGGIAILAGLALMNLVELVVNHRWAGGAFPYFAIPGVLYLAAGLCRRSTPAHA